MVDASTHKSTETLVDKLRCDFLLQKAQGEIFYINSTSAPKKLPCVIAIGAFDGCHLGHVDLLEKACADAQNRGVACVAVTFDPDPDQVLPGAVSQKLMTTQDRLHVLSSMVDSVAVVPFTQEVANLDHETFFRKLLASALDIQAIHVGSDFRLGKGGAATVEVLQTWGSANNIAVYGHELVTDSQTPITATRIRSLIATGDISTASLELGRRPLIRGVVSHGRGQGSGMGFPTANIEPEASLQLPKDGVYAGYSLVDGKTWPSAINVGLPPMFENDKKSARLEIHLIGYSGNLYEQELAVVFDRRLRSSQKFKDIDELINTVNNDISVVQDALGTAPITLA